MTEWADDAGSAWWQRVRCIQPMPIVGVDETPEIGCGWTGKVRAVRQYGAVSFETEECEECGGRIEAID